MRTAEAFLFLWQPGRLQAEVVEGRGLGPGYSRVLTHLGPVQVQEGQACWLCVDMAPDPVCPLREWPGWSLTEGVGVGVGRGNPQQHQGASTSPWGLLSLLGTK